MKTSIFGLLFLISVSAVSYASNSDWARIEQELLAKARIRNLVGGFKDQIAMWDVVNEPINTVTREMALKDTISDAKIDEGSRYNVKGITLEQFAPWVKNSYMATYKKFDELGLPLHITEFIPQSSGKKITEGWREGVWTEEAQAEFAEQFYILSFGHPSMKSIHWWGLSDRLIWLKGGGLLDKDFNPKPVYTSFLKLIKEDWMTKNLKQSPDKNGLINFRGFYGKYHIKVTLPDGSIKVFDAHLAESTSNNWSFSL
jgi:hypothetical protein